MDITHSPHRPARKPIRLRRHGPIGLAAVGLVAVLLASACDTAEQVPWATYNSQLQTRIDSARVSGNCAVLQTLLTDAKTTSRAHEKATGFPNDALVSYIQVAQHQAGCPAGSG